MAPPRAELLDRRALSMATLARQLLLERARMPTGAALEHLVGMQAQAPHAPYVGLWTRLDGFTPDELSDLLGARRAVRAPLMRATLHLVTARDCLRLRPIVQPVLERGFAGSPFKIDGLRPGALIAAGRSLLAERPRTRAELGEELQREFPSHDRASLAQAVTYLFPVVQVPPRGLWGVGGAARWAGLETWLDGGAARSAGLETRPDSDLDAVAPREQLLLRYLAAFGPATVRDAQTWSGLSRLAQVADRLRPQLRTFRDENGSELLDLPEAPRPDPATPAPPRFLPQYDNLLLSHGDRTRFITRGERVPLPPGNGSRYGTLLADGVLSATWRITTDRGRAVLHVQPFGRLARAARTAVEPEGERLLRFVVEDAEDFEIDFARA